MKEVPIEFWGVIIVALSSIFTNVLTWFLTYRSTRMKFETETRARYIQEVLRDHYVLYNYLRQLAGIPIKEEILRIAKEAHNIMNERPYNFKVNFIHRWFGLYEMITLLEEYPDEEISKFQDDVLERITYFEKEYEKMLGIQRS